MNTTGPIHFLNLEYFFRIIYDFLNGIGTSGGGLGVTLAEIWSLFTYLAYIVTLVSIGVLVYATVRFKQTEEEEAPKYTTEEPAAAEVATEHSRWKHIAALVESPSENDWRQAIIEADIMLEDILTTHGYVGETVGEKLKQGDPAQFHTLRDAWDAHMVRNQIAHEGSAYALTDQIAYRTIAKYKNVFEEFRAI
jgi:hypothetical protein